MEAQQAHVAKFKQAYVEVLRRWHEAEAAYQEVNALYDEAEVLWPRSDVLRFFQPLPPGMLNPNGKRSVGNYIGEMLTLADPSLLPADDPARMRVEASKASGQEHRLWFPGLIWGD